MASGVEVLSLTADDLEELVAGGQDTVRGLKERLKVCTGQPRFRQRLLRGKQILGRPLRDIFILSLFLGSKRVRT